MIDKIVENDIKVYYDKEKNDILLKVTNTDVINSKDIDTHDIILELLNIMNYNKITKISCIYDLKNICHRGRYLDNYITYDDVFVFYDFRLENHDYHYDYHIILGGKIFDNGLTFKELIIKF